MASENLYDILGVKPNATKEEIKASYRKLVRKFHPDINKEKGAEERFKKLTAAVKTLTDDVERLKYDSSMGFSGASSKKTETGPKADAKPKQEAPKGRQSGQEFYSQKAKQKEESAFSKIFHEFFDDKGKKGGPEPRGPNENPKDGEDDYTNIVISEKEAKKGTLRQINIVHSETCPKCGGRKFINGAKCTACSGQGEKTVHKKLSIKIPPNISDGMKIRVANEGRAGKNGGKNGDLYLNVVIIQENSIFETKGNETFCTIPITPWEAALGANIQVPTPSGSVLMKIPPSTPSGQKFKLVENGAQNAKTGKKGDLIVTVTIEVPKELTEQEIELYEKLKILDTRNVRKELFEKTFR